MDFNLKRMPRFAGYGAVKILPEDDGMFLLGRAVPCTSLKSYFPTNENESIEIACRFMKKLHQANIPVTLDILHPERGGFLRDLDNFPHIRSC